MRARRLTQFSQFRPTGRDLWDGGPSWAPRPLRPGDTAGRWMWAITAAGPWGWPEGTSPAGRTPGQEDWSRGGRTVWPASALLTSGWFPSPTAIIEPSPATVVDRSGRDEGPDESRFSWTGRGVVWRCRMQQTTAWFTASSSSGAARCGPTSPPRVPNIRCVSMPGRWQWSQTKTSRSEGCRWCLPVFRVHWVNQWGSSAGMTLSVFLRGLVNLQQLSTNMVMKMWIPKYKSYLVVKVRVIWIEYKYVHRPVF